MMTLLSVNIIVGQMLHGSVSSLGVSHVTGACSHLCGLVLVVGNHPLKVDGAPPN